MAAKLGVTIRPQDIAPPQPRARQRSAAGPRGDGQRVTGFVIDCDLARVYNVADAASLAESAMPPIDTYGNP